ncbi:hypothetical protein [Marivita cryptomonadis]|nr:hypothetical protein [Marivita cryptomonadis]MBM2332910.1 hypothetical protein [Marivita cryptomonadis]MBM2351841.1 hypothetical protein [Marivita cryptomonadis]MBM2395118.1 hypothetical protein [Marivita cryptomonadis]MBM2423627.1 hypothetical protein [Marivita cryptomonadis]MBM2460895.1 hypothetical protein [Marivita cryptomonadis]
MRRVLAALAIDRTRRCSKARQSGRAAPCSTISDIFALWKAQLLIFGFCK